MRESKTRECFTKLTTASNVNTAGHAAILDVCENYYTSEEEMIAACSSEYFFEVKEKSSNLLKRGEV